MVKTALKGNEGFTLVELLVVVAIMAILSTSLAVGLNRVSYANFQKAASQVYNEFNDCRSICMSHATPVYTYLYNKSGDIYIYSATEGHMNYTDVSAKGRKIASAAVEVLYVDSAGDPDSDSSYTELTDGNMIEISFKTNGSFKTSEPGTSTAFYKAIRIKKRNGSIKKDILMIQETGKRFMQ